MPVIDAHVHLYPPEINRDPAAWARAHAEPRWARMCVRTRKSTGRPVQAFPSVDGLLRDMDEAGVDRAVLLGWYWENQSSCETQNRFYAACVRAHPDRFSAFATVQPAAGAVALDEVRRARNEGLAGLGELSPHSTGISTDDGRWLALLTLADELRLPVNLHVTEPDGENYPGRVETPLDDFAAMARAFPRVRFILAHWGGRFWRRPGHADWPENVWVDTAAGPLLYGEDPAVWNDGLRACGADRVLWGTDYPLDLFPSEEGPPSMGGFLTEARRVAPESVLGANSAALLGIRDGKALPTGKIRA